MSNLVTRSANHHVPLAEKLERLVREVPAVDALEDAPPLARLLEGVEDPRQEHLLVELAVVATRLLEDAGQALHVDKHWHERHAFPGWPVAGKLVGKSVGELHGAPRLASARIGAHEHGLRRVTATRPL